MKARLFALPLLLPVFLLPSAASCQQLSLPVLSLNYDGGTGWEEIAPEDLERELEEKDSQRHRLTLRVKEQWSDAFASSLSAAVSRKDFDGQAGSYTWFYLHPDFQWDLGDRLRWSAGVRSKWTCYDELDEDSLPKDLTSLLAQTALAWKPRDKLRLEPYCQAVIDLYRNQQKSQQTYVAGLRLESRLGPCWRLSGRYRGIARLPLGGDSAAADRFNQEFGLNLSWDPNR